MVEKHKENSRRVCWLTWFDRCARVDFSLDVLKGISSVASRKTELECWDCGFFYQESNREEYQNLRGNVSSLIFHQLPEINVARNRGIGDDFPIVRCKAKVIAAHEHIAWHIRH